MKTTIKPNAIKIEYNQDSFMFMFAQMDENENILNEICIQVDPRNMLSITAPIIEAVSGYQDNYDIDLGMRIQVRENDAAKEE